MPEFRVYSLAEHKGRPCTHINHENARMNLEKLRIYYKLGLGSINRQQFLIELQRASITNIEATRVMGMNQEDVLKIARNGLVEHLKANAKYKLTDGSIEDDLAERMATDIHNHIMLDDVSLEQAIQSVMGHHKVKVLGLPDGCD
ncbi:MAG: hypothetical protein JW834_02360 [Candidatus Diapherotrites archaeon]|nr:hypothetical protein [Candidatus Diapherotrites archaeon]